MTNMTKPTKHKWTFAACFRRQAFGWRSQPAINRVKEAVAEIKTTSRKDPILAAEGAVLLLEKLSPALEQVDSSSGAIGTAVNNAIETLIPFIAEAPADEATRSRWLERLWKAVEEDDIPYIELLPEYWGTLCRTPELASHWADELIDPVRITWSQDRQAGGGYFKGTSACLSALFTAGRYAEILELLDLAPYKFWHYRKWGVKALIAMGKKAAAIRYAEDSRGLNEPDHIISEACEEILLASGMADEAYSRYAIEATQKTTYLATFRAIAKKYPYKAAKEILSDLVASLPGNEGKWFAAAKSAGLYSEAIELANRTPCDPKTLTRAARDMKGKEPLFAVEAGMAALRWLVAGYGYEITGQDVREAYNFTMEAAVNAGCKEETLERIRNLVMADTSGDRFVSRILGPELGMPKR
jgi:tetratricopeptide (TPR) repeat protein